MRRSLCGNCRRSSACASFRPSSARSPRGNNAARPPLRRHCRRHRRLTTVSVRSVRALDVASRREEGKFPLLISASSTGTVFLWDLNSPSQEPIHTVESDHRITCLAALDVHGGPPAVSCLARDAVRAAQPPRRPCTAAVPTSRRTPAPKQRSATPRRRPARAPRPSAPRALRSRPRPTQTAAETTRRTARMTPHRTLWTAQSTPAAIRRTRPTRMARRRAWR